MDLCFGISLEDVKVHHIELCKHLRPSSACHTSMKLKTALPTAVLFSLRFSLLFSGPSSPWILYLDAPRVKTRRRQAAQKQVGALLIIQAASEMSD